MTTDYQSALGYTVEKFRSSSTKLWEPEISIHNSKLQEANSFCAVNICSTFVKNRMNDAWAVLFRKEQCIQRRISVSINVYWGERWRSWLRHYATNRQVVGSIPDGVIRIFQWHKASGRGVDSASNTNEYQVYFLGVKAAGA